MAKKNPWISGERKAKRTHLRKEGSGERHGCAPEIRDWPEGRRQEGTWVLKGESCVGSFILRGFTKGLSGECQ